MISMIEVWEAAISATIGTLGFGSKRLPENVARVIVAATLAERKECASEVDELLRLLHSQYEVIDIGREDEAFRIAAAAIRKRGA